MNSPKDVVNTENNSSSFLDLVHKRPLPIKITWILSLSERFEQIHSYGYVLQSLEEDWFKFEKRDSDITFTQQIEDCHLASKLSTEVSQEARKMKKTSLKLVGNFFKKILGADLARLTNTAHTIEEIIQSELVCCLPLALKLALIQDNVDDFSKKIHSFSFLINKETLSYISDFIFALKFLHSKEERHLPFGFSLLSSLHTKLSSSKEYNFALAQCYYHGKGVAHDLKKALRYFHLAAKEKHIPSMYYLASYYANDFIPSSQNMQIEKYGKNLTLAKSFLSEVTAIPYAQELLKSVEDTLKKEEEAQINKFLLLQEKLYEDKIEAVDYYNSKIPRHQPKSEYEK